MNSVRLFILLTPMLLLGNGDARSPEQSSGGPYAEYAVLMDKGMMIGSPCETENFIFNFLPVDWKERHELMPRSATIRHKASGNVVTMEFQLFVVRVAKTRQEAVARGDGS